MGRRDLLNDFRVLKRVANYGVLRLQDAAAAFDLSYRDTTLRMRALVRLGAVHRIARGVYFIIPIDSRNPPAACPHDGRAVASARFHPCYVGGWSAADAWDLCLSFKLETFVVTSSRVRSASVRIGEFRYRLAHIPERLMAGPDIVPCYGGVLMSNPERTLVDGLRSPSWIGGARPLAQALREHHRSARWDPDRFVETLLHAGSGAAIKRLGALIHLMELGIADVLDSIAERRTRGIVALEPGAGTRGRIDTRSGVRLNVDLDEEDEEEGEHDEAAEDEDVDEDDWDP